MRRITVLRHLEVARLPLVRHYVGVPPELSGSAESRELLGIPSILVIEQATTGRDIGFFLLRFTKQGAPVGDTWHMTLEDALEQAAYEYGDQVQEWVDVPPEVDETNDQIAFALAKFAK